MENMFARWSAEHESWLVSAEDSREWQSLDEWARSLPDLTPVGFVLCGSNYVARWINLPGVQGRHLTKALPFALEESLIQDISEYHIVPAGKQGKHTHRVYCTQGDWVARLQEACEHHHLQLRQLTPVTSLIPENSIVRDGDAWLINLPGLAEAEVHEAHLGNYFEGLFTEDEEFTCDQLTIHDTNLDGARLLKTQIESGHPGHFSDIQLSARDFPAVRGEEGVNLLTGSFRAIEIKTDKPAAWWKPLAALAACWAIFSITQMAMTNKQLIAQESLVRGEAISLYKKYFPNERIRNLEKQIRGHLKGDATVSAAGAMSLIQTSAKVMQEPSLKTAITWDSFKFNDRQNLLTVELTANSIALLQNYKTSLETAGLSVEIASATNENQKVKGRLKIGGAS